MKKKNVMKFVIIGLLSKAADDQFDLVSSWQLEVSNKITEKKWIDLITNR